MPIAESGLAAPVLPAIGTLASSTTKVDYRRTMGLHCGLPRSLSMNDRRTRVIWYADGALRVLYYPSARMCVCACACLMTAMGMAPDMGFTNQRSPSVLNARRPSTASMTLRCSCSTRSIPVICPSTLADLIDTVRPRCICFAVSLRRSRSRFGGSPLCTLVQVPGAQLVVTLVARPDAISSTEQLLQGLYQDLHRNRSHPCLQRQSDPIVFVKVIVGRWVMAGYRNDGRFTVSNMFIPDA